MRKYLFNIFSICFIFLFAIVQKANATHSMGSDLTYRCVGNNTYEITLSFYRDCVGIAADDSAYVEATSSCQGAYYCYLQRVPGTGQEITPICPSEVSTCNGGVFTGIQEYVYQLTVILPGQCADWTFSYNLCCRNNAITNITTPGAWQMYVYATLNNTITPCNNSPTFSNKPVPFVCLGQQFCFNHGAYDVDGDSLVYTLITPWDSPGLQISYLFPFSASNPLSSSPAMTFNSATGDICMTPTALEVTVMAVLVEEYRNGVLIGSVERDIQVTVINCTNQVPALSGMNGTNNFSATTCAGSQICFNINSTDANAPQNTFISWDNSIPGATFNVTAGNRESGTFCWTPTLADVNSSPHCFTVTVHDDNCPIYGSQTFSYCIDVQAVAVTVPNQVVGCNGTTTLTATATGSTTGYTYLWSTGATTQSITAGAGNYNVTVSNGTCTATTTATITSTAAPSTSTSSTPVSCNGGNNGTATAVVNGGTGPFTYSWSPSGGNGTTATNLAAGNYTFSVTDAMGCISTSAVVVTQPTLLTAAAASTPVLCNGGNTGTASANGGNGTPGYNYAWSPSGGNAQNATGLAAGNYTVTITDANGCTATATTTVTQPTLLTAAASSTPVLCNAGSDGTATVVANNGTPGYTYAWTPSGGNAAGATGLAAGSYTVTITDANGCTTTANATVTQPTLLVAVTSSTPVLCNAGADGTASVVANDGTPGYSYAWAPSGGNAAAATGLTAGNYSVTVTDANGCTTTATTTVTEPTLLIAATTSTPVLCNAGADGTAAVIANNGTPGYSYVWSPSGGNTANASGLAAGNYSVTVTDANGCTTIANTTVTEPTLLIASASSVPVLCTGGTDGSAAVIANDGTPGYTYSWTSGGTGTTENSLAAGTYTVTVTDANGCTTTANTTVTEPTLLVASASATNVLCNAGADGTATVIANDGTPGYSYSWTSGGTGATEIGLASGTYTVTVTDANGCTTTTTAIVTEPTLLVASASSTPALCNAGADGTASVVANDGTPGYTYSWSSGGTGTTENALAAGTYTVTVTDANGCTTTATTTVTEPTLLVAAASSTPVLCNGGSDGSAAVMTNDGTPGYSYLWTSGGSSSTENGLAAGTYTVTVTDANGCTTTASTTVTEPTLLVAIASSSPVLCNGGNDGSATVVANDGTPGYTYSWNSGGAATTENALSAGSYTVTVTDANGCITTATAVVTEPTQLVASASSTNVLCNGGTDGSTAVVANDGTPGYSYSWSSGGTGTSENSLPAGTYSVIVTDANGCTVSATTTVNEPPLLTASTSSTPVLCNAGADGSSTVVAADGTPGYTYSWSSGGTGATENGLTAGIYVVTVTDANGCTSVATSLVTEPTLLTAATSSTDVLCNGGYDGTASVIAIDGTPGYSYSWSSGGTGANEAGLAAGNYSVTVTDANGCTTVVNSTVAEPSAISIIPASVSCLCFGSSDGSASANVTGGVGTYIFSWAPGGASTATINNLTAGNYTLTVTDINGCVATSSAIVSEPPLLTVAMSSSPALCNGEASGSAVANANGGTGTYTYSWFPSGGNGSTESNLYAGNYSVTIIDANGCVTDDSIVVTEPVAISLLTNTTPAICGSSNGTASVAVNGGSSPYQYAWSPSGGTNSSATNISAGAYTVIVTDANGCTSNAIANVMNTGGPGVNALVTGDVSCNGGSDGSANVNVTSGTPPYTYAWSPAGGNAATATGLSAGNYAVTVTDANGCISSGNVIITEPSPVAAQSSTTNTLCFGSADGTAAVNAAGGTAPYSYSWSPGGATTATATNLGAGNYTVTVTDANGCITNATAQIQQPTAMVLAVSSVPALCHGASTGSASVYVSGGTGGYSYAWTPGNATTQVAGNLSAGNYSVIVTDAHGCTSTNTASVSEPAAMNLTSNFIPATCGSSNGSAAVVANGGMSPYSYQWTPMGGTNSLAANLSAGSYTVTVTDANGCTGTMQVNVSNAGGPIATATVLTDVSCYGGNDGSASLSVSSGNPPFTYIWSPSGGNGTQATGLIAGNYSVVVADAIGCITMANISITEPPQIVTTISSTPATCGDANGSASVTALGGTGNLSYNWTPSGGTTSNATGLAGGNYSVVVTDANGCNVITTTTVVNSGGGNASLQSSANVTCNGGNDGAATVTVSGGAAPYTYLWTPTGDTLPSISNIPAGNYSVAIADSVGCVSSVNVIITEPPAMNMLTGMLPAGCNGAADGSAYVSVSGGTAPYSYAWSPVVWFDSTLTNIAAGVYSVAITDQHGCIDSTSVTVTSPSSVTLNITATDITCFGMADGSADVTVLSGTGPFTYSWSPGSGTGPFAEYLSPGDYNVTVTDSNGCESFVTATIVEPPLLVLTVSPDMTLCIGQETMIGANASGGTQPYSFLWDNGITTDSQLVYPVSPTAYSVEVVDSNGCSAAPLTININVNPPLNVIADATPEICAGDTASISALAGGGNGGPYFYTWNNGAIQSDEALVYPQADSTFVVTVNDGCSPPVEATVHIIVNPVPQADFLPQLVEGCMPVDAAFTNHGNVPAGSLYSWNLGDGTTSNESSVAHTYATPGHYTVSLFISTTAGCTADITVVDAVNVFGLPEANFEMSSQEVSILNPSIDFYDHSTDAYMWNWDFGDKSGSSNMNPVHNYPDTGTYVIQLIVVTEHGCLDTIYNTLRVKEDFTVFIPNAYTPNGDNINDGFMADGIGWRDFEMFIIDRWGLEIFHSTSKDHPWNATYYDNGNRCQSDVYEYIILIHDKAGTLHKFLGHVSLVQ
ncbi:MAG: PKD domain-containing protein [Bacteroidetes bacterium]|nr:PKD domain-containing protein [Bacteroidota bacterium]